MKLSVSWFGVVVAAAAMAATAAPVQAADDPSAQPSGTVFVQTNDAGGNAIDVFDRNSDGTLTFIRSYATGGNGGREVGATSDPLASQAMRCTRSTVRRARCCSATRLRHSSSARRRRSVSRRADHNCW